MSESSDRCESEEEQFNSAPLLPEVELPTHEEEEEELVKLRAKLYRFDSTNEEGPEWKVSFTPSRIKKNISLYT